MTGLTIALGLVVFAAAHHSPWLWHWPTGRFPNPMPQPQLPDGDLVPPPNQGPIEPYHPSTWFFWFLLVLGLAATLALLFYFGRWLFRLLKALWKTKLEPIPATDKLVTGQTVLGARLSQTEVTDIVDQALMRLEAAVNPTDAVIAAWLTLEAAAKRHGYPRGLAQTPTEFTVALLEHSKVPVGQTDCLRRLYLKARFSSLRLTKADVRQARLALEEIRQVI